ncbi:MAG TPA: hypothetical protein VFQ76_20040 [Longimicrobiaceae bacterium]|nr:hypothetical protein [Longimicrobiaceae bacterium]
MQTGTRKLVLNKQTLRDLVGGAPAEAMGTGVCSAPTNPDVTVAR